MSKSRTCSLGKFKLMGFVVASGAWFLYIQGSGASAITRAATRLADGSSSGEDSAQGVSALVEYTDPNTDATNPAKRTRRASGLPPIRAPVGEKCWSECGLIDS